MAPFGKYLSKQGTVSRPALEEATQAMVVFGGRLGTHLVESGALTLEQLENHLAQYLSVSTPPAEALARPDPKALEVLPRYRVTELKILPFRLEDRTLHVAMRDPRDTALVSALAKETGLRVRPYLLSEVRLFFLLQQHFGVDAATRYQRKPSAAPKKPARKRAAKPPARDEDRERQRQAVGIGGLGAGEEFVDEQTFASMVWTAPKTERLDTPEAPRSEAPAEEPTPPPRRGRQLLPLDQLLVALDRAQDRSEVARHALEIARHHAPMAALFAVRNGLVRLLHARSDFDGERTEATAIPVDATVLSGTVEEDGALLRGAPSPHSLSDKMGRALGRQAVREAAVYPVTLAGRVVNLLYVDNGPEHLDAEGGPALRELCEFVAKAYERIILSRKKTLL